MQFDVACDLKPVMNMDVFEHHQLLIMDQKTSSMSDEKRPPASVANVTNKKNVIISTDHKQKMKWKVMLVLSRL